MSIKAFISKHGFSLALPGLVLLAFLIRFYGAGDFSFSNDELSALIRLRFNGLAEVIDKGVRIDGHPAATQILLYIWTGIFGQGEWITRLPFILMGSASILLFYSFTKSLSNRDIAIRAAILLSFSLLFVVHSRLARPYSMGIFAVMLQWWAIGKLSQPNPSRWQWAIFIGASVLAAYTHHFAALTALITGLSAILILTKKKSISLVLAGIASILLYLPHLSITLDQLNLGGVGGWLGKPDAGFPFSHVYLLFNETWWMMLLIVLILVLSIFIGLYQPLQTKVFLFLGLIVILPLAIGYAYSTQVNPVLQHSVLLFSSPALFIIVSSLIGFTPLWNRWINLIILAGMLISLQGKHIFSNPQSEDFKGAAAMAAQWNKSEEARDSILNILNINNIEYFKFYYPPDQQTPEFGMLHIDSESDLRILDSLIHTKKLPLLGFYNLKPERPEAYDLIIENYPVVIYHSATERSATGCFAKQGSSGIKLLQPDAFSILSDSAQQPILLDTMRTEFSLNHLHNLNPTQGKSLCRVSVEFRYAEQTIPHILVAVSEDNSGNLIDWYGISLSTYQFEAGWNRAYLRFILKPQGVSRIKLYLWNPDPGFLHPIEYRKLGIEFFNHKNPTLLDLVESVKF